MSMIELTRSKLDEYKCFNAETNPYIEKIKETIPFNISDRMKAVIAVTHITTFAAQFRRNIVLWDGTEVPINSIAFIVSGSGKNKDSSINAAYKSFKPGYKVIEEKNKALMEKAAIAAATEAGEDAPDEFQIYKEFMTPEVDVITMPTTGPGLIDHINATIDMPLGATLVNSSEFADELAYNQDMVENIKILSEVYDVGIKQAKHTKGVEFRSKSIEGASVNALFIGSPTYLLYDEATKKKFQIAFMSKLARRSWFCYSPEKISEPDFDDMDKFFEYEDSLEKGAADARKELESGILDVTTFNLNYTDKPITVSKEVERIYKTYKRYNNDLVDESLNQETTSALIRRHLQWKALKFAGALAVLECCHQIEVSHYIDAIRFCELLDNDMEHFEYDLNKAPHERFSDYARTLVRADNKAVISIHDIKKHGFTTQVSKTKLQELVKLCAGYDEQGIYTIINEDSAIQYEPVIKTDVLGVSFKPIDNTRLNKAVKSGNAEAVASAKQAISTTTAYGFEVTDTTFAELGLMLEDDFAYSPFKFRNGVRGKNNIIGGTKWLVLDVDDSPITATEAHFLLSDINHHVALSSDPNNEYKFRVLIELDSPVELSPIAWKHFFLAIANDLALKVDPLPQSQIFFSYADRPVLSVTDSEPLEVRDYVMNAVEKAANKDSKTVRSTPSQDKAQLNDSLETFAYAFNAEDGSGSRNMYRAGWHAKDLGATSEEAVELLSDINNYWTMPMDATRLGILQDQIRRLYDE